ncbi:LysR family transcriptional regulator [Sphingomonas sp.]|uniref:LysR family transcriptional regulator n=1 Tax=Sphingomonas sp. TaxID=28214 RepID=UPI000DB0CC22|nr:LysR family transcriptional regulator [Sphingomonas sp.]PZU05809.1 MAG: LysR family transcriptional regulator [Sphingomonas sp.]
MIDLNDLRVFSCVAQLNSFSEAARSLDLPRSSVSRCVARLEEALHIRLLQRTTREVRLTSEGKALLDRCSGLLVGLDEALTFTASLAERPHGRLTISAGIGFGINVLGKQLPSFLERYPDVHILLDLSSREAELVADGVDVAIRMGPLSDSAFVATRLGSMTRYLCASVDYLERRGIPTMPDALLDHDLIDMPTPGGHARPWVLTRDKEVVRLDTRPRVLVNDALTVNRLVCEHGGIGVISAYLCGPDIMAGKLTRLLPDWTVPSVDVSMVFPTRRELSPAVRAFVDFMREANIGNEGWKADPLAP